MGLEETWTLKSGSLSITTIGIDLSDDTHFTDITFDDDAEEQ
jgi:hypothetical protein